MAASYQELRKLYYIDKDTYKNTYQERYNSDLAIKPDFLIKNNPSFFVQSPAVVQAMYEILRLDKRIDQLCCKLPGIALQQYSRKCLIDEIVLSNNIEGVHSSRKEIGEALAQLEAQSERKGHHKRFEGLVNKYLKLIRNETVPLTGCRDIRSIYDEIVLEEVVAEDKNNAPDGKIFRKEQSAIRSATDKIIHTGITPESRIIEAMNKALNFLNDPDIDPLYRISIFHYMFEYIHPFYDGNGRTGRFILSYCISETMTPLLAYRISETIKENINEYYKAFTVCNDPHSLGDLTPFLIMMLKMIKESATELKDSLERKLYSWEQYQNVVNSYFSDGTEQTQLFYSLLIQASLFSELGISTAELTELLKISYVTLKNKYIEKAIKNGLLVENRIANKKYYSINTTILDQIMLST